jgi:hypothetical protein
MMRIKHMLRYMHTTQERRRWFRDAADGVVPRRSRSPIQLPSAWSDVWRRPQRSWKKHRRHKWRQPGVGVDWMTTE